MLKGHKVKISKCKNVKVSTNLNHEQGRIGEKDNAQLWHNPYNVRLAVEFRKPTDWENLVKLRDTDINKN